jgi:RNA polymerase sigma factor (sigma-70 family)
MDEPKKNPGSQRNYHSWKTSRSEEWLADAWRKGDQLDKDLAGLILFENYQPRLLRYLAMKLPYDWVEPTAQEVWVSFYKVVTVKGVRKGVPNLLWTMAKARRADAVRKLHIERNIESNVPLMGKLSGREEDEAEEPIEKRAFHGETLREERQFVNQILTPRLSECERVILQMRGLLGCSTPFICKLLGKSRGTVYSTLYVTKQYLKKYWQSEDFDVDLANREIRDAASDKPVLPTVAVFEYLSNPISPGFIDDEVLPFGFLTGSFHRAFVCSILLPWSDDPESLYLAFNPLREGIPRFQLEPNQPYLVLTERTEWDSKKGLLDAIIKNPEFFGPKYSDVTNNRKVNYVRSWNNDPPLQTLMEARMVGEHLVLKPKCHIWLDFVNQWVPIPPAYDGLFLSLHPKRSFLQIQLTPSNFVTIATPPSVWWY